MRKLLRPFGGALAAVQIQVPPFEGTWQLPITLTINTTSAATIQTPLLRFLPREDWVNLIDFPSLDVISLIFSICYYLS
ncbi:MAG: hypothetical protein ACTS4W_00810 [Candidatus Hodgkinia cicadicola]